MNQVFLRLENTNTDTEFLTEFASEGERLAPILKLKNEELPWVNLTVGQLIQTQPSLQLVLRWQITNRNLSQPHAEVVFWNMCRYTSTSTQGAILSRETMLRGGVEGLSK